MRSCSIVISDNSLSDCLVCNSNNQADLDWSSRGGLFIAVAHYYVKAGLHNNAGLETATTMTTNATSIL